MYNTKVFKEAPTSLERGVRGAEAARRQVEQGPRAGVRRADLHRRRRAVPDGAQARARHQGSRTSSTRSSTRRRSTLLRAAAARSCSRYWHDAIVQVDDFTNEGVVASGSWPFQVNLLKAKKQPIASTVPAEGATGWADTTMLHAERRAPELRLQVDGALARAQGAGRPRRLVRLGAGRCRRPARATSCSTDEGCKTNGFDNFDKIHFWRTPVAKCASRPTAACPTTAGSTDYIAVMGGR